MSSGNDCVHFKNRKQGENEVNIIESNTKTDVHHNTNIKLLSRWMNTWRTGKKKKTHRDCYHHFDHWAFFRWTSTLHLLQNCVFLPFQFFPLTCWTLHGSKNRWKLSFHSNGKNDIIHWVYLCIKYCLIKERLCRSSFDVVFATLFERPKWNKWFQFHLIFSAMGKVFCGRCEWW